MIDPPKTLEEANKYRYSLWSGVSRGVAYHPGMCAYSVWIKYFSRQCSKKNGYGPAGLYCKQHSKMVN